MKLNLFTIATILGFATNTALASICTENSGICVCSGAFPSFTDGGPLRVQKVLVTKAPVSPCRMEGSIRIKMVLLRSMIRLILWWILALKVEVVRLGCLIFVLCEYFDGCRSSCWRSGCSSSDMM